MSDDKLAPSMKAFMEQLSRYLVSEPVEPAGILSRIETHIASLRELLTLYDIDAPSLAARLASMEYTAEARHEFLREFVVSEQRQRREDMEAAQEWLKSVADSLDAMTSAVGKVYLTQRRQAERLEAIEDRLDAMGANAATRQAEILKRIAGDAS
jgi:hypothetical protein